MNRLIKRIIQTTRSRDFIFVMIIFCACLGLISMPDLYQSPYAQNTERVRGKVLEVDNSLIQQYGIVKAGSQKLRVEILDGEYRGRIAIAGNDLIGKMETDKMFAAGDTAYMVVDGVPDNDDPIQGTAYDHYRIMPIFILVLIFCVFLVMFAGWSGLRALLSFAFAILFMWKILFPLILKGVDPVWVSFLVVFALAGVTLLLVAGVRRVALVALIGASLGILLTIGLAMSLFDVFNLHGAVQPYSETLLYTGFEGLDLARLFLAAIFIGASGAVMDVAIDVATAMNEVFEKRPDLGTPELILSGFTVGRAMTSTMVTTLLMAYISGYMSLLMVFMAQGVPPVNILNTNYVAAEIFKTIIGSFGLITVAPFTAVVGGFVLPFKVDKKNEAGSIQPGVNSEGSLEGQIPAEHTNRMLETTKKLQL